jgi:hypothetical protein
MSECNRRTFMFQLVAGGSALAFGRFSVAAEAKATVLTEDDAYAKSMGFRLDTTQVDQAKYPKHTVEQKCSECQLFSGEPGEQLGPCSFFGKRLVPVDGWCRNFKPKGAA